MLLKYLFICMNYHIDILFSSKYSIISHTLLNPLSYTCCCDFHTCAVLLLLFLSLTLSLLGKVRLSELAGNWSWPLSYSYYVLTSCSVVLTTTLPIGCDSPFYRRRKWRTERSILCHMVSNNFSTEQLWKDLLKQLGWGHIYVKYRLNCTKV